LIYVDTSVIISYVDVKDPNHGLAENIVGYLKSKRAVVSYLVLVELASVYSRAGLDKPLELALYSIDLVGAEIVKVDFNEVLKYSFKYAPQLQLKTLDLLHIVASSLIRAKEFATLDKNIVRKANKIKEVLGVKVLSPQ